MPDRNEEIGELVRRGATLFSEILPFPVPNIIGAVSAAIITGIMDLKDQRTEEILSLELGFSHISYVEPDLHQMLQFYRENPLYPGLATDFQSELASGEMDLLRSWHPYLYGALILKRRVPQLLFHREIEERNFRALAEQYELVSRGYHSIQSHPNLRLETDRFSLELRPLIEGVYEAAKSEIQDKENRFVFEWIDWIRDLSSL